MKTKQPPATKPKKNGVAQDAANAKAEEIIQGIIDKIIAERGVDNVGEEDRWEEERREGVDDYTYDLAVEVRKMREAGAAWWRIAHDLYLPGHGPSAAQGKSGAAYARRLWQRAWGLTYTNGEKAPRETRARRQERAVTREHRPYFAEDARETDIIKKILGQKLTWVARLGDAHGGVIISEQQAYVHPDARTIKIALGPQGRYVEFFETLESSMLSIDPRKAIAKTGPRRAVYLDRIEKVGA